MSSPSSFPLPSDQLRRTWRIVTWAGVLGMVWGVTTTSTPRASFLVQMGFEPWHFGLLESLVAVALLFQVVAGYLANRLPRRKSFWMVNLIALRLLAASIVAAPLLCLPGPMRIWFIMLVLFVQSAMSNLGEPLWMSWMADLLPRESLNRHWAGRQRVIMACQMVVSFSIAGMFWFFNLESHIVWAYGVLVALGTVLGLVDILLFARVPEPAGDCAPGQGLIRMLTEPVRDPHFRPFLAFMCMWKLAIAFLLPFVQVYLLKHIGLETYVVQTVFAVGTVGMVLSARFWGLMSDTYGHRTVIQLTILGRFMYLGLIFFCPRTPSAAIPLLVVGALVDGVSSAGVMISFQTARLQLSPRRNRSMYIGAVNVLSMGIAGGLGASAASFIVKYYEDFHLNIGSYRFVGMHIAFGVSFVLRILAYWLAGRIPQRFAFPMRDVGRHLFRGNPFAVLRSIQHLSESPDAAVRVRAARRLGAARSALAFRDLVLALQDPAQEVRRAAADALGRIGVDFAREPLERVLADPDSGIQHRAAHALGRIGGGESARAILQTLDRLEGEALVSGVRALGRIGDSAAIFPLIDLYRRSEDRAMRRQIAVTLGTLAGGQSPESVMEMLSDRTFYRNRF